MHTWILYEFAFKNAYFCRINTKHSLQILKQKPMNTRELLNKFYNTSKSCLATDLAEDAETFYCIVNTNSFE